MSVIELWVYLSTSPLLWLTATLGAYVIADRLSQRVDRNPIANPVLIAVLLLMAMLGAVVLSRRQVQFDEDMKARQARRLAEAIQREGGAA